MDKQNENGASNLKHRIWEKSVGIVLEPMKKNDGTYFWNYSFTRGYKKDGQEKWSYSDRFSSRNDEAVGIVMAKRIAFEEQNDATAWAKTKLEEGQQSNAA